MENVLKNSPVDLSGTTNAGGFEQFMNRILKIVEGGNADDLSQAKLDQLIPLLEEYFPKHHSPEQSDHSADDTFQDPSLLTPDQKMFSQKSERQAADNEPNMSSGGSISVHSGKQVSEFSELNSSSSSSSSDSDTESYYTTLNKGSTPNSLEIPKGKFMDIESGITGVKLANAFPSSGDTESYDLMGARIAKYEEELRGSKSELLSSNQEVMRLQSQLKNALVAVDDLEAKLEKSKNDQILKERDLTHEKMNASELQVQVEALETELLYSGYKIEKLEREKEADNSKLKSSEEKISDLKHTIAERDGEINKLNVALQESKSEKAEFQSQLALLEANLTATKERIGSLEKEVEKYETSKLETKSSYEAQEIRLLGEIKGLNMQLVEKNELVESLNKAQDGLKLKYDMLVAEKDGLNANMQHIENQLHQLQVQNAELIASSEALMKRRDELGLKVEELEKEAEKQAALIEDRAEEKREAIRQLCLSLEHYRSGYKELHGAWVAQTRNTVMAS